MTSRSGVFDQIPAARKQGARLPVSAGPRKRTLKNTLAQGNTQNVALGCYALHGILKGREGSERCAISAMATRTQETLPITRAHAAVQSGPQTHSG